MGSSGRSSRSGSPIPARAIVTFAIFALTLPAVIFLAAGTLRWPMGWVYYGIAVLGTLASRAVVAIVHADLLAERAQSQRAADAKDWDRPLSLIVGLIAPFVSIVVVGLDKRWSWSPPLPGWVGWLGAALFALGYAFSTWALGANRFFSGVVRIQKDRGHYVVTGGPYRIVRHPGYAGGVVSAFGMPLLLGSVWGFIPGAVYIAIMVVRTALEDRTLHEELPGYREYAQRTRYRLLPGVW